jgi:hypothetical protein
MTMAKSSGVVGLMAKDDGFHMSPLDVSRESLSPDSRLMWGSTLPSRTESITFS